MRCEGKRRGRPGLVDIGSNKQCVNEAKPGSRFCGVHSPEAVKAREQASETRLREKNALPYEKRWGHDKYSMARDIVDEIKNIMECDAAQIIPNIKNLLRGEG